RKSRRMEHRRFASLPEYLHPTDLLLFNDTRVFPARLYAKKRSGNRIELLLLRPRRRQIDPEEGMLSECWEVLARGKGVAPVDLLFDGKAEGRLIHDLGEGRRELVIHLPTNRYHDIYAFLEEWGEVPLPPYIIKRKGGETNPSDRDRYQTVYAKRRGSAAAPTAGLHFTEKLIKAIREKGVPTAAITLHIGLDTFQPIRSEKIRDHKMHREWFQIPKSTADLINATRARGGRVLAVGTTVTRVLETASQPNGLIQAGKGETDLFITPGVRFKGTDALITNFHLPRSTLLVLVSAFAGDEAIRSVYREAIRRRYRFYSYGDAMLIL
ncbi:MAG: tRNA preQ1(34) S-adenosylmethionine ribosyltransferase-isomerase QueA, partial [Nitrospiria bacterium]